MAKIIGKLSLSFLSVLLVVGILISGGCNTGNPAPSIQVSPTGINQAGAGLSYVANPLPAWTAGQFGSVALAASGGRPPYNWAVAPNSVLPDGLALSAAGVLAGTPPLLPGGTTERITPPFTVIVTDANGQRQEITLQVTIIQPKPQVFNLNVAVAPAGSGSVTQSLSPDPEGYHEGDMVMLTAVAADGWIFDIWASNEMAIVFPGNSTIRFNMPGNDVNITARFLPAVYALNVIVEPPGSGIVTRDPDQDGYLSGDLVTLTAEPADGWTFDSWESLDIAINDPANTVLTFNMPEQDVTVTARFTELPYEGEVSTIIGYFGASNGCSWEAWVCGTFTLKLEYTGEDTIGGTADFSLDIETYVTGQPWDVACDTYFSKMDFGGELSGTTANFGGSYASPGERPLQIVLTAVKNGDRVTCTLAMTKVMQVTVNGVAESYPTLSKTVTVEMTKQQS